MPRSSAGPSRAPSPRRRDSSPEREGVTGTGAVSGSAVRAPPGDSVRPQHPGCSRLSVVGQGTQAPTSPTRHTLVHACTHTHTHTPSTTTGAPRVKSKTCRPVRECPRVWRRAPGPSRTRRAHHGGLSLGLWPTNMTEGPVFTVSVGPPSRSLSFFPRGKSSSTCP